MTSVTASIVTYNTSREDLSRVIDSALREGVSRIYVVDHSPRPGVESLLPSSDVIEYIPHDNLGYGSGHNVAIRKSMKACADYHVVLNPDIYWTDPVIATLTEYMNLHADVGQMLPKVLNPDGTLQYTCKLVPTPFDLIVKRFLPAWMTRRRMRRFRLERSGYDHIMDVPYMHGCFMLLRNAALKDVGLFDERFFMYPEDIDLTRRIHARWRTLFYPYVSLYHVHAAASRKSCKMLRVHIVNMIRYFDKWGWFYDPERRGFNRRLLREIAATRK